MPPSPDPDVEPPGMPLIALDIETIHIVDNPDFSNPEHWIPFCVAVGFCDRSGSIETDVIFREDGTLDAERQLLLSVADWIEERVSRQGRVLLTYNGRAYDMPVLEHRARKCGVYDRLDGTVIDDTLRHTDLMEVMVDKHGSHVSLDAALNEFRIEVNDDGAEWLGKELSGADMPDLGLELLSSDPDPELVEAVATYAKSDVEPLFELAEKADIGASRPDP